MLSLAKGAARTSVSCAQLRWATSHDGSLVSILLSI